jgi:ribosomal protein S14
MTITAKYPGRCKKCGGQISAGEQIEWEKSSGASHIKCPAGEPVKQSGPKQTGQLWEECPRCGREPIYMPLHLCDHCWPKTSVTPKIDTSCAEPYRRGIGQGFGAGEDGDY